MFIPLFLCIGFFIAVLYTDLVYDISALPYRKSKSCPPREVMEPIVMYYGYITKRPTLLVFCLLIAAMSITCQIMFHQVTPAVGYVSAAMIGSVMLLGMLRVIPAAQRLASRKDVEEVQARLLRSLLPSHIIILILVLSLALLQFNAATS